jgi:hypothetical protein
MNLHMHFKNLELYFEKLILETASCRNATYIRPKVAGPLLRPHASGSYVHRVAIFLYILKKIIKKVQTSVKVLKTGVQKRPRFYAFVYVNNKQNT